MNIQDQIKYYTNQIFMNMAYLEKMLGKLFHEAYPETEKQFWIAVDSKNKSKLMYIHNHLCKEIDEVNSVIQSVR